MMTGLPGGAGTFTERLCDPQPNALTFVTLLQRRSGSSL